MPDTRSLSKQLNWLIKYCLPSYTVDYVGVRSTTGDIVLIKFKA